MIEALLYTHQKNNKILCQLCPHRCSISEGGIGVCGVRKNVKGHLLSLNYDRVVAVNLDPIEKKPLYHFLPASKSLSIAAMGCNLSCHFCQNHHLSMIENEKQIIGTSISSQEIVTKALLLHAQSISYTYSEPTVFIELMIDTAKIAKRNNLKNVMVTNGYMTEKALEMITPNLDAANIDLKSYSDEFYKKYCGARLEPVLETIREMKKREVWVEITTLLIPGLNTDFTQLKKLIEFILSVNPEIPWHVSRFFPQYLMQDIPETEKQTIFSAINIGVDMGLKYVYGGNVNGGDFSDTFCPSCHQRLICRKGYSVDVIGIADGKCRFCLQSIPGIWR